MFALLPSLGAGLMFGLAFAAPPDPINAVIAEESVVRGWTAGAHAGLGTVSTNALFFVLAAPGLVAFIGQFPTVQIVMIGAGGILTLYFAYGAAQEMDTMFHKTADPDEDSASFTKTFVLTLTSPYQILFWLTVGVGLLETGTVDVLAHTPYLGASLASLLVVETGSPAFILGFFDGIAVRVTGFPTALVMAEQRIDSLVSAIVAVSAVVLDGLGVVFTWGAMRPLVL